MDIEEIKNGTAALIDVRSKEEWEHGHASLAVHFDLELLQKGELPSISPDTKLYLYCMSGARASYAKMILENKGYKSVEVIGGLNDVLNLGL